MKDKKRGTGLLQRVFAASAQLVGGVKSTQNNEKDEKTIEKPVISAAPVQAEAPASAAPAPAPKPTPKTYKVTGLAHYMENLMALAEENSIYDYSKRDLIDMDITNERVYQYTFSHKKAELVPEPDNPVDPKAIKVVVDGQHVGYIKAGSCAHLNKVIRENRVEKIDCEISGGKYKIVLECWDDMGENSKYTFERDEAPFWVHLHIVERDA